MPNGAHTGAKTIQHHTDALNKHDTQTTVLRKYQQWYQTASPKGGTFLSVGTEDDPGYPMRPPGTKELAKITHTGKENRRRRKLQVVTGSCCVVSPHVRVISRGVPGGKCHCLYGYVLFFVVCLVWARPR